MENLSPRRESLVWFGAAKRYLEDVQEKRNCYFIININYARVLLLLFHGGAAA
jgi:hypothetical protein